MKRISVYLLMFLTVLLLGISNKKINAKAMEKATARKNVTWISSAHRGKTSRGIVENTIPAFRLAVKNHVQCIECDLRQTKDGVVVISHDDVIKLMNKKKRPVKKRISRSTYADLLKMPVYGSSASGKCTIASLDELLTWAESNNIYLNLDCKVHTDSFVKKVARKTVARGFSGRCMYNVNSRSVRRAGKILKIDKKAMFVWRYNRIPYRAVKKLLGDMSRVYLFIPCNEVRPNRFKKAKKSGCKVLISEVSNKRFKKAAGYHPDMIEFISSATPRRGSEVPN